MAKQTKETKQGSGFVVVKPFRDRANFELEYQIEDDVNHLDEDVLESLIERGLVELAKAETKAE